MANNKGLALIEIIIVIGIMSILAAFTGFSLIRSRNSVSLDNVVAKTISDIKNQQIESMNGYSQGGVQTSYYGIYFETNRYTLFHTSTYQANDSNNFVVNLDTDDQFVVINIPQSQIVFASESGEISNFSDTQNFITIENTNSNQQKTLYFNRFGAVYAIN
ncbi:prepilin-type N-terminal cleavage/methylation domain-containing protein [Patescibacteria group bacterium]|nr:prepilin-type N-terminal cleavage/methylation domain-containing protein [Patescibacteria group bacterium]